MREEGRMIYDICINEGYENIFVYYEAWNERNIIGKAIYQCVILMKWNNWQWRIEDIIMWLIYEMVVKNDEE